MKKTTEEIKAAAVAVLGAERTAHLLAGPIVEVHKAFSAASQSCRDAAAEALRGVLLLTSMDREGSAVLRREASRVGRTSRPEEGMMTHGAMRNSRRETTYGEAMTLVDTEGKEVYSGPLSALTQTVEERWCASCGEWVTIRGILGVLLGCPTCGRDWEDR